MTKCDFCTESNENGKCFWSTQFAKRDYCIKAIDKMSKFLDKNKLKKLNKLMN